MVGKPEKGICLHLASDNYLSYIETATLLSVAQNMNFFSTSWCSPVPRNDQSVTS